MQMRKSLGRCRLYVCWYAMIQRVTYPKYVNRRRYDELKLDIQEKWKTFEGFFDDMWESYESHVRQHGEKFTSLDRIDNLKGYSKKNCEWSTPTKQARNRRSCITLTINKKRYCLQELTDATKVPYATAWARIKNLGWSTEQAIMTPVGEPKIKFLSEVMRKQLKESLDK